MAADGGDDGAVPVYHVITPGDHFSPRTGSAIPTVVHGLATGAASAGDARRYPQRVMVQSDTYRPRYGSAPAIEYVGAAAPDSRSRLIDAGLARVGMPRRGAGAYFRPVVASLRNQPDGIVLAHNAPVVPWLLRDQAHRPVLYAHNDVLRSYSRAEASRVLGDAAAIVAVSESLASQLRERLPNSLHERVRVVRNGVDTGQFTPGGIRSEGPLRVLFIGRAIPEKGVDVLLHAAVLLGREDVEYTILGSYGFDPDAALSPYERELRELAASVPGSVSFVPFADRDRLPNLLRGGDVLVVPSRWQEPSTLTIGEGMATGMTVVASRRGGIPEVLGDAGILFDPDKPEELAGILAHLADDRQFRESRSAAALARARRQDWSWAWSHLAAVLDELRDTAR